MIWPSMPGTEDSGAFVGAAALFHGCHSDGCHICRSERFYWIASPQVLIAQHADSKKPSKAHNPRYFQDS